MTAQPIERTDLETIEALDWEHEPGCEHRAHDRELAFHSGVAFALIHYSCLTCPRELTLYACRPYVERIPWASARCGCGASCAMAETHRVIALVG